MARVASTALVIYYHKWSESGSVTERMSDDPQDQRQPAFLLRPPDAPVEVGMAGMVDLFERFGVDLRLNIRTLDREWRFREVPSGDWGAWKVATESLEAWLVDSFDANGVSFTKGVKSDGSPRTVRLSRTGNFNEVVLAICQTRQVDPFREWLDAMPAWDGVERVDLLLSTLFGAEDDTDPDLAAWASRFPLIGAIERAERPGSKIDEVPVLVGPQGSGKSAMLSHLFDEADQDAYRVDLSFALTEKERVERTDGAVIAEINEMAGSTSAAAREDIKSWLSKSTDRVRRAYARSASTTTRRFIHVGTTNRRDSLPNDPTGNRRFVVIETGHLAGYAGVVAYLAEHRAQLWAEAVDRHRDGLRAHLPEALRDVAAEVAEGHRYRSSETIEDAVADIYMLEPMTLAEIKSTLEGKLDDAELRRDKTIRAALEAAGWTVPTRTTKPPGKKKARYYYPPEALGDTLFE